MCDLEQVNKLRSRARDLRRDLAGAALPVTERQRRIMALDYCLFDGTPESLLEADVAASRWLACDVRFQPSDFKSEDGAVLAWGRARVIEKFAEMLTKDGGELTAREVTRGVQDILDLLPRKIAQTLPKLRIKFVERLTKDGKVESRSGRYRSGGQLQISTSGLKGLRGAARKEEMRRILSHELMHWVHIDSRGPAADAYRAAIRAHYLQRTAGEKLETSAEGYKFRRDGWWKDYCGVEYDHEHGRPRGLEIPTTYFELWEQQARLLELSDQRQNPLSSSFRETFSLVQTIFDATP